MITTNWLFFGLAMILGVIVGYVVALRRARARAGEPRAPKLIGSPGASSFPTGLLAGGVFAAALLAVLVWALPKAGRDPWPQATVEPSEAAPPPAAGSDPHLAKPLDQLAQRLLANPDDLDAKREMGLLLLSDKQYMEAFEQAEGILGRQPSDPTALYIQGVVRLTMGQRDRGQARLEEALASDPSHVHSLIALGTVHLQDGDTPRAVAVWERALQAAGGRHAGIEKMLANARATLPGGADSP